MPRIEIKNRQVGDGAPVYIVAEMSANHNQSFEQAVHILQAAKESGADAVKLQTYTPDTMTIHCDNQHFRLARNTPWAGYNLYDLYGEAYTPWDWQPKLKEIAAKLELDFFSTPFDHTAVDFLENLEIPVYKIASFELVDLELIRRVARTGKPIIISTGMATLGEIDEAVHTARESGATQIALLKCNSAYPAPPGEMHLRTIPHLAQAFDVPVGLSDHTLEIAVPVAAVTLGACIIEKHFVLSRQTPGPDTAFSLEPQEFRAMVDAVRVAEKALGEVHYQATEQEFSSKSFRRSLFVIKDMAEGDTFTSENVRSIRPGYGLMPKYLPEILGRRAVTPIKRGTPLEWKLIS